MRRTSILLASLSLAACGIGDPETPLDPNAGDDSHGSNQASHSGEMVIAATSTDAWVHWSFDPAAVVSPGDPATSAGWHLRFRRTQIGTNSGTSGPGNGGALDMGTTDFDAVTACPSEGYIADALMPIPGPPGSGEYSGNPALAEWFDYDPATHAVSSKGRVYCARAGDGYGKFVITSYGSGQLTIRYHHF